MKVYNVSPGRITCVPEGWGYTIILDTDSGKKICYSHPSENKGSCAAAKQMMRERVAHERKRHGLE